MDGLLRLMAEMQNAKHQYNPHLRNWERSQPNNVAGKGYIEKPGQAQNIIWQTRSIAPSDQENALAEALQIALGEGADSLKKLAASLNEQGLLASDGSEWSDKALAAELKRLGA